MTLDEAIKHAEEVVEENSKSYEEWLACKNRGNVGWSKSDIEAVDKSIEQCKKCAEEHRQLAEWLKDYKRLKKQEPCADMVSRDAMWEVLQRLYGTEGELVEELMSLPPVLPKPKIGKWIYRKEEDSYRCSLCTFPCHKDNMGAIPTRYCAECGAVMEV